MAQSEETIQVEIAYALPDQQYLVSETYPKGTTLGTLVEESPFLKAHPEIKVDPKHIGIWYKLAPLSQELKDGDRVQIYRDLLIDPRDRRRKKATEERLQRRTPQKT